jgi:hypothetical protein
MAQGDINIANQGFPSFRADLNDQLEALVTNSSGATDPDTTFPYQWWMDTSTTPNTLRQRNGADDAWIVVGTFDQSANEFVPNGALVLTGDQDAGGVKNFTGNIQLSGSQVYARSNILDTVSQSGGVPTGGIIERGSNANGEFVKFADGTAFVVGSTTLTRNTSTNRLEGSYTYPISMTAGTSLSRNYFLTLPNGVATGGNPTAWISDDEPRKVANFAGTAGGETLSAIRLACTSGQTWSQPDVTVKITVICRWF